VTVVVPTASTKALITIAVFTFAQAISLNAPISLHLPKKPDISAAKIQTRLFFVGSRIGGLPVLLFV
jgi:hypothetical protein